MSEILKSEMMKQELRRVAKLLEEWADTAEYLDNLSMGEIERFRTEANKIHEFLGRIETD